MRFPVPLHGFLQEFQSSGFVALLVGIEFEHFAFVVDSPPKIVPLSSYLHEDLVQVPLPLRTSAHRFRSAFPDFVGELGAEPIDPETDAFVADVNAALVEQVLDIPQRERKPDIHQHGELDDLG